MPTPHPDYFRCDQSDGITVPDLSKDCSLAEHIVHARGKRTQLTSISLNAHSISEFGPVLYRVLRSKIKEDSHLIIGHSELMQELQLAAESGEKEERVRALQALRYAKRRREGLVRWRFTLIGVERKELITWAFQNVQKYFRRA